MTKAFEFFFDVVSPASYLAWNQVPGIADEYELEVLNPEFAETHIVAFDNGRDFGAAYGARAERMLPNCERRSSHRRSDPQPWGEGWARPDDIGCCQHRDQTGVSVIVGAYAHRSRPTSLRELSSARTPVASATGVRIPIRRLIK